MNTVTKIEEDPMIPLASRLEGKTVGYWEVGPKRQKTEEDNSGAFSSCYLVHNTKTGAEAFLKAYNYQYAFRARGGGVMSADFLKELTSDFVYERDILALCADRKMKRVVTAVDSGEYYEDGEVFPVPFLVFEVADGSLKKSGSQQSTAFAWKLKVFHGALVGVAQLHAVKIAHQDIKPSNILIFGDNYSKVADLGQATMRGNESRHDGGDLRYAPIELLYGYCSPDWETRRFGADFFMVGGILCSLVCGMNYLSLLHACLHPDHRWDRFGGGFKQALPYLERAHAATLEEMRPIVPEAIKDELVAMLDELCFPEPEQRGSRAYATRSYGRLSLQPYISKVDRFSKLVEWQK